MMLPIALTAAMGVALLVWGWLVIPKKDELADVYLMRAERYVREREHRVEDIKQAITEALDERTET